MWGAGRNAFGSVDAALAAFEQSPTMLSLCEGPDLVVSALNTAARVACGDQLGLPAAEALPDLFGTQLLERLQEVYDTGRPFEARGWPVQALDADGDRKQIFVSLTMTPCFFVDGSMRGVVTIANEVPKPPRGLGPDGVLTAPELRSAMVDALLPAGLPILPEVDLAGRYLLAGAGTSAGGDWFDAILLPDGRIALVVGEVVGRGVNASVVMGQLKTILEERLRTDGDMAAGLEALDRRARWMPEARAATVCVAILDARTGALSYCTAGHPPPLVVGADGHAVYLPPTGAGPLASGHRYEVLEAVLRRDDVLLLYSDALVARPGRSAAQNTLDLLHVAGDTLRGVTRQLKEGEQAVERICARTVELLTPAGSDDDIIVFAAQRKRPMEPLAMAMPAALASLRVTRSAIREWLSAVGVSQLDEMALRHAVGELVSNAVEHAYVGRGPQDEATVWLHMCLTSEGVIEAQVVDHGRWRPPRRANGRGRGLALAKGFTDELEIHHDARGTTGTLRLRVLRRVQLFTSSTEADASAASERDPVGCVQADGLLVITGAIDQNSSDEVRRRLSHANHGGASDVMVDLTGVTHLASAGVQLLYEAMSPWAEEESHVHLIAAAGSTAQHVLDLVRLPYTAGFDNEPPIR